jgi:peptidoglycan/xylan/chitin deacetylase (PgdA/CDA1 family)
MPISEKLPKFLLFTIALFFAVSLLIKVTNFDHYFGINRVDTEVKVVALTYDDGPYPTYTN